MNIKTSHILGILHIGIMDGGKYMEYDSNSYLYIISMYSLKLSILLLSEF